MNQKLEELKRAREEVNQIQRKIRRCLTWIKEYKAKMDRARIVTRFYQKEISYWETELKDWEKEREFWKK